MNLLIAGQFRLLYGLTSERCNDLDGADQISIEFVKIFGRNPILLMDTAANRTHWIPFHERPDRLKPPHVSCSTVLGIPALRYSRRVLLVQNRIKERAGQTSEMETRASRSAG